ncbi:hypothetical protein [Nonomuraea sp. NPDC049758]|uniref:hypothetical protein n=1 Tax=Nonomuraea sp. NPDC049758 TaxID=3154360 RepID=UPI003441BE1A
MIRTVAVDFDRVVHRYSRGWADGTIYDPPMDGALDGLRTLMEHYSVFIHTSRTPADVADWLAAHELLVATDPSDDLRFWVERGVLLVTNRKLPASVYLDDRAVRFTSWPQALHDLLPDQDRDARRRTIRRALTAAWPDLAGDPTHVDQLAEVALTALEHSDG